MEVDPVDEDGMVTVRNDLGEQGAVKISCLGNVKKSSILYPNFAIFLANLVKEWKVIKKAKILGAPGNFVLPGEIVNEEDSEDEDGMVQIRTKNGVTGAVRKDCLGIKIPLSNYFFTFFTRS